MQEITCGKCGIVFGVPDRWLEARRQDKTTFYCPNGDPRAYVKSEADKLREQLEKSSLGFQAQLNTERHARLVAEKSLKTETAKRRKIEKRVANGVCPCCNRFVDVLDKHMKTKHPEYVNVLNGKTDSKSLAGTLQ